MNIEVSRKRGGHLTIRNALALAIEFFTTDISSSGPDSYDERALASDPRAPFTHEDVLAIRTGMRLGRLREETWPWLVDESPRDFLGQLDPESDLVGLSFDEWRAVRQDVKAALAGFIGEGRQVAVVTKLLHFKRPRLIPILDSLVVTMLGLSIPEFQRAPDPNAESTRRDHVAEAAMRACDWLRRQAEVNKETLMRIQSELRESGLERSLARIFDALLWSVHPASQASHSGVITWSRPPSEAAEPPPDE